MNFAPPPPDRIARLALEETELRGYKAGEFSRGKDSEMLDVVFNETEDYLTHIVSDTSPINYLVLIWVDRHPRHLARAEKGRHSLPPTRWFFASSK